MAKCRDGSAFKADELTIFLDEVFWMNRSPLIQGTIDTLNQGASSRRRPPTAPAAAGTL